MDPTIVRMELHTSLPNATTSGNYQPGKTCIPTLIIGPNHLWLGLPAIILRFRSITLTFRTLSLTMTKSMDDMLRRKSISRILQNLSVLMSMRSNGQSWQAAARKFSTTLRKASISEPLSAIPSNRTLSDCVSSCIYVAWLTYVTPTFPRGQSRAHLGKTNSSVARYEATHHHSQVCRQYKEETRDVDFEVLFPWHRTTITSHSTAILCTRRGEGIL